MIYKSAIERLKGVKHLKTIINKISIPILIFHNIFEYSIICVNAFNIPNKYITSGDKEHNIIDKGEGNREIQIHYYEMLCSDNK